MSIMQAILGEFEHEAATTRRLLERVPADKFDWKPHEKSFSLLQLTTHLADMPGWMATVGPKDELDLSTPVERPDPPKTTDELLARYDKNVETFKTIGAEVSDDSLMDPWRLRTGDKVHFEIPRVASIRTFILNHFIHHRGQLSVYLRLLDVPLPSIYGPSADENVFE